MARRILGMICFSLLAGHLGISTATARALVVKWKNADFYNQAISGFTEVYGKDVDIQDCQGSKESVDRVLGTADKYDLVVVIGETPLKRAVELGINKPVIYAMVYNPSELLGGRRNITGVSLNIPADVHLAAIKRALPNIRRVGVVSSQPALIAEVKQSPGADGLGITGIVVPKEQITEAIGKAKGQELIYMTLDKSLATQEAYSAILFFGMQNKIPVYGISDKLVKAGALLGLAADYGENGKAAGRLALEASRSGKVPPSHDMDSGNLYLNLKTARDLGISLSPAVIKSAVESFDK